MGMHTIGVWDYLVIGATLLISVAVGLYFRFTGGRQKTAKEYLMGGNNMSKFPVVFSLAVTRLSSIVILGEPSEVYLYGTQRAATLLFSSLGIIISAYVFLPVFFNTGGCSVHEYLQKRFGKTTRLAVSVFWSMQTIFYMAVVLYTPSLSLSSITEISTETSIVLLGVVCTVYSSMGGLKAVIWTDLFQAVLMCACLLAVLIQGVSEVGSFKDVWEIAEEGKRLEFFNMSPDLTVRYTFWNALFYGLVNNVAFYGVNQAQVQRLLSVKSLSGAQSSLLWSILPFNLMHILSIFVGLTLYAVFVKCDPLSARSGTGLFKSDQIVPYFIVTRMGTYPSVAGLCVAGIFSGSLSSLSSAVSSLTTVAMVDFIGPIRTKQGDTQRSSSVVLAKVIGVFYGFLITGLAFIVYQLGSVLQAAVVFNGIVLGPLLGLFSLGMLTTRANEKGVLVGLFHGILFSGFIGFLCTFKKYKFPHLILSTEGCPNSFNTTMSSIIANASLIVRPLTKDCNKIPSWIRVNDESIAQEPFAPPVQEKLQSDVKNIPVKSLPNYLHLLESNAELICASGNEVRDCEHLTLKQSEQPFMLHKVSYMWVPMIGFFVTLTVGYLASFAVEVCYKKKNVVDPQLMSPIVRRSVGYDTPKNYPCPEELENVC